MRISRALYQKGVGLVSRNAAAARETRHGREAPVQSVRRSPRLPSLHRAPQEHQPVHQRRPHPGRNLRERAITISSNLILPVGLFWLQEATKWVNQQLGGAGYSEQLVTDLGLDMTDGITLLHLVQALGACIYYIGGLFHFFFLGVMLGKLYFFHGSFSMDFLTFSPLIFNTLEVLCLAIEFTQLVSCSLNSLNICMQPRRIFPSTSLTPS